MRFLILIFLLFCAYSIVKVGIDKIRGQEPKRTDEPSVWEAPGYLTAYPTGRLTSEEGKVESPYLRNKYLDVRSFRSGQLVRCGHTNKPFYVPARRGLSYGEIVGDWLVERRDHQTPIYYKVRIMEGIDGVAGHGKRIRVGKRELPLKEQTPIFIKAYFYQDELRGYFSERDSEGEERTGIIQWRLSSSQDLMEGDMRDGEYDLERQDYQLVVDSRATRIAGMRGLIPASGKDAYQLVPDGWRRLDHVEGKLGKKGKFLVVAVEESGETPWRWLIVAHREHGHRDFQTMLASPHACLPHRGEIKGDPFMGLTLPEKGSDVEPGVFAIRHHAVRGYQHEGLDMWFRYEPSSKQWRLSEGKSFEFDLSSVSSDFKWTNINGVGVHLGAFDIRRYTDLKAQSRQVASN